MGTEDDAWQVEREHFEDECLDAGLGEVDPAEADLPQTEADGADELPGEHESQDEEVCHDDPYLEVKSEVPAAPELPLIPRLLAFLHGQDEPTLTDATTSSLVAASRRLWRLGALEPQGYGLPPKGTALGAWMAKCSRVPDLPPSALRAIFFGALWGCLVPLAALVAILMPLEEKPKKSLRNLWRNRLRKGFRQSNWSGHFILVASYLKWKESQSKQPAGLVAVEPDQKMDAANPEQKEDPQDDAEAEETKLPISEATEGVVQPARGGVSDAFWEAVDAKTRDLCAFAQRELGYSGDDVAEGTTWTVASLLRDQNSLVLAALCAAFPPRRRPGDWVVQPDLAEGFPEVESRVSNAYACLFASSAPRHSGNHDLELAGIHARMKSGSEASFKDACAIRALLASNLELALKNGNATMKPEVIQRALGFLSSPSGDFFECLDDEPSCEGSAEEVGLGILTLLGRADASSACGRRDPGAPLNRRGGYKEALQGRMVPSGTARWEAPPAKRSKMAVSDEVIKNDRKPAAPAAPSQPSEAKCVEDWAIGLVQAALLRVLKKRAVAAEEFDVAARLKAREGGAEIALAAGRARAKQLSQAPKLAQVEELQERKRKAVEVEDYELAGQLKREAENIEAEMKASTDEASLQRMASEQAKRLASMPKHRFKLLKAAGAEAMASNKTSGHLWEEVVLDMSDVLKKDAMPLLRGQQGNQSASHDAEANDMRPAGQ